MSVKQQLADTRRELADMRRDLNRHMPGRTTDNTTAWDLWQELADWLRQLDAWDWPTTNSGMAVGTIGRTGHSDPTPQAATQPRFRPDVEATVLLDHIQKAVDQSIGRTLGGDHEPRRPRTRATNRRPDCNCNNGPHAASWTHCPWTGQPLYDRQRSHTDGSAAPVNTG